MYNIDPTSFLESSNGARWTGTVLLPVVIFYLLVIFERHRGRVWWWSVCVQGWGDERVTWECYFFPQMPLGAPASA